MADVIGIDHIYIAVSDLPRAERFYDVLMQVLRFRKKEFAIGSERHVHYYNRHFGYVLRPARSDRSLDPYAPGLHHFCLRVETREDVEAVARTLADAGLTVSTPQLYPQYAPDYFACFLTDPDGVRLEITNYRLERRKRHDEWNQL